MPVSEERWERLVRWAQAWAEAERALKIGEQQLGDVVIPAIKELRYSGRKVAKALDNYGSNIELPKTDLEVEDAIFDCYRARHDATDAATAAVTLRLERAVDEFGIDIVKEYFPAQAELAGLLLDTQNKIAAARRDTNGRPDLYQDLEVDQLPKIIILFQEFKAQEPHMKDKRFSKFLLRQGINLGWIIALVVAVIAIFR